MRHLRSLVLLTCSLFLGSLALAETWLAGPTGQPRSFIEALALAQDGDVIEVLPGTYKGQVGVIGQKRLTIRGVGARPVFEADGQSAEGKAIWVIRDGQIEIDNIEFRGTRVADGNGAGLRFERGQLLVRRCRFADNQNGLLTSNFIDAELSIIDSEFSQAPHSVGSLPHLLYAGRIAKLEVRGSRFHNGFEGHLIKSRARANVIAYNLIYDGPGGGASYEIDLPVGGDALIIGNIVGQSSETQNPVVVSYGAEGRAWDTNSLLLSHNTFVSDYPMAWYLRAWLDKLGPGASVRGVNNLTIGAGFFTLGASGDFDGNWPALASTLVDPGTLAFELRSGSWLRGRADDPRQLAGDEAVPTAEFVLPIGTRPLKPPTQWSPGALQR
jgi:hypothetical protein